MQEMERTADTGKGASTMLSERERRILAGLERQMGAEDPRLARLLAAGPDRRKRWRTVGRYLITTPALILAVILGIAGCGLHLSALGMLFFLWVAGGVVARLLRAGDEDAGTRRGSRNPGHRAGSS
jgi:DUF3040 family protein